MGKLYQMIIKERFKAREYHQAVTEVDNIINELQQFKGMILNG